MTEAASSDSSCTECRPCLKAECVHAGVSAVAGPSDVPAWLELPSQSSPSTSPIVSLAGVVDLPTSHHACMPAVHAILITFSPQSLASAMLVKAEELQHLPTPCHRHQLDKACDQIASYHDALLVTSKYRWHVTRGQQDQLKLFAVWCPHSWQAVLCTKSLESPNDKQSLTA